MIKKIIAGLKERWYRLHKTTRHAGGSAVLLMIAAGVMQMTGHTIDWAAAALISFVFGLIKELLQINTIKTLAYDVMLNSVGIALTVCALAALGNKI